MDDYEKIKRAMESLKDHMAYKYLVEFVMSEKQASLNKAMSGSADDTLRSMGAFKALDKVSTFIGGNSAAGI